MNWLLMVLIWLAQPTLLWERDLGVQAGAMLLVEETLYLDTTPGRNAGSVIALDAVTGATRWEVPLPAVVIGDMAYTGGRLLVGTTRGLYALDRTDGTEVWHFAGSGSVWGSPLVVGETVFITAQRGVFALDVMTGEEIWRNRTETSFMAYDEDTLYLTDGNQLVAVEASTGVEKWRVQIGSASLIHIVISAGVIYTASEEGHLYAVDQADQRVIWEQHIEGAQYWSRPLLVGELLITGNMNHLVYGFDSVTGDIRWQVEVADWATADGLASGEVIYFGVGTHETEEGNGVFYALEARTGAEIWRYETAGVIHAAPVFGGDRLYVMTINGKIYAWEEKDV